MKLLKHVMKNPHKVLPQVSCFKFSFSAFVCYFLKRERLVNDFLNDVVLIIYLGRAVNNDKLT